MDTLATGVHSSTDTSWQFTGAGSQIWERADFAEYDDRLGTALEVIRLMADHDTAATDVTVVRAQRQTSAGAETAVGNATFDFTIFGHILHVNKIVCADNNVRSTRRESLNVLLVDGVLGSKTFTVRDRNDQRVNLQRT